MATYTVDVKFGVTVEADSEEEALRAADRIITDDFEGTLFEGTDFELSAWEE